MLKRINKNVETEPVKWVKERERKCYHPEHFPPSHIVLEAGTYEYTCPKCGEVTVFEVQKPSYI